jgi:ArsR family transcriptional regulator
VRSVELPTRQRGVTSPPAISLAEPKVDQLVEVLKALADPTRLHIVSILLRSKAPVCICDLTAAFALSQPTVSHHMARLKEAQLVDVRRKGIWSYYRLRLDLDAKTRALLNALIS